MRSQLLCLFLCLPLAAQTQYFSFGFTGGVPMGRTTGTVPYGDDESRPYTFGLSLEGYLNDHVSVNVNPLYRRTGVRYGLVPNSVALIPDASQRFLSNNGQVRSHSLELPVIGKYTFLPARRTWRPFAGAGFAFQTAWQTIHNQILVCDPGSNTTRTLDSKYDTRTGVDVGAVFSTGVILQRGRFRYVPEIRFTRWGSGDTSHRRSQFDALFSIRF